jgi:HPt (histidine-containing phosphotransfer) domain-containing protein
MLQLFIDMIPGLVKEMSDAYEKRDFPELGRVAHKIKPNLDNMQIASLTQTIRDIEMMGKTGTDSPELSAMISQVQTVVEKVIGQIKVDHAIV